MTAAGFDPGQHDPYSFAFVRLERTPAGQCRFKGAVDMLNLRHGLKFEDLYLREGLLRVDNAFLEHLGAVDAPLRDALLQARAAPDGLARKAESDLLIALSPHLEDFIAG